MARISRAEKDKKIIEENPGKSPYELLQIGLSEQGYESLVAQEAKQPEPTIKEVVIEEPERLIPEVKPSGRAMPRLINHHVSVLSSVARVKSPDGKITTMERSRAIKFVNKQKALGHHNYKIID